MRKNILLASVWSFCTLVVATPRPLSWKAFKTATAAQEAPSYHISTDLTLGPTHSASAELSLAPPSPQSPRRSLQLPLLAGLRPDFGQPPRMPWLPVQVPDIEGRSASQTFRVNTDAGFALREWRPPPFPLTPILDRSIERVLRNPLYHNYMRLPVDAQYVHSVWFDLFYHHAVQDSSRSKRVLQQVPLTGNDLHHILGASLYSRSFLHEGSWIYKVPIPLPTTPIVEPGEVLVRYHNRITLPGHDHMRTHISVWSTMDSGSSLAFLGLYPVPDKLFEKLMSRTQARKFKLVLRPDDLRLYLEPTGGHHTQV